MLAALAVWATVMYNYNCESTDVDNIANPPAAPLAVRSPYLNTWLNGRRDGEPAQLAGQWPQSWK